MRKLCREPAHVSTEDVPPGGAAGNLVIHRRETETTSTATPDVLRRGGIRTYIARGIRRRESLGDPAQLSSRRLTMVRAAPDRGGGSMHRTLATTLALLVTLAGAARSARAEDRTFAAGSLIIPMDLSYQ